MKYRRVGQPFNAVLITKEHFDDHSTLPEWIKDNPSLFFPPQGSCNYKGYYQAHNYAMCEFEPGYYLYEVLGWGTYVRQNHLTGDKKDRFEKNYRPRPNS